MEVKICVELFLWVQFRLWRSASYREQRWAQQLRHRLIFVDQYETFEWIFFIINEFKYIFDNKIFISLPERLVERDLVYSLYFLSMQILIFSHYYIVKIAPKITQYLKFHTKFEIRHKTTKNFKFTKHETKCEIGLKMSLNREIDPKWNLTQTYPIFEIWYKNDSEFEIWLKMTANLKSGLKLSKIWNLTRNVPKLGHWPEMKFDPN